MFLLLTGCWHSLENAPNKTDAQPFYEELERDDIVVAEYETSLMCPDNYPASILLFIRRHYKVKTMMIVQYRCNILR